MYMKIFDKYNEYYKSSVEKIEKITDISNQDNYNLKFYKLDETKNIVDVSDKISKKLLLRCEYRIAGYYNISNSIWTWSWSNPFTEKNLNIDKQVFTELKDSIQNAKINQQEMEEILYYLDDQAFHLSYDNMNNRLLKFIMYNLEAPLLLTKKNDNNQPTVIEIIAVKEILQIK